MTGNNRKGEMETPRSGARKSSNVDQPRQRGSNVTDIANEPPSWKKDPPPAQGSPVEKSGAAAAIAKRSKDAQPTDGRNTDREAET